MSRRVKLIITALFLVLLAIPTVYVILTWSPPNPLRFRLVGYEDPSRKGQFRDSGKLNMIVENTSSVPVYVVWATMKRAGNPDSVADPFSQLREVYGPDDSDSMIIPPHTSLPCFCPVLQDEYPASAFENIELFYGWMSANRVKASQARIWLFLRVPEFVRPCIPINWPTHDQDTTPLLPALSARSSP
ncbi:hypothetical protein [Roseimicrobium sp. ORNL1]|uniref:hypothetical protein n=1 Tax=Roseimicrobium sp. ORNL1 TaxID=2711231 RepID=UPI0013E12AC0|nr:hypothetical protein [Roseimicrobium sp. ORNL1]QIF01970.1 hypothetical protein G5S37_10655 [Roseimicrobium sp. ORNL1]